MAAPKGNQYAVGHGCGRPCKYDLEQEAKELLEFSERPDSLSIYQFVNPKEYCADSLLDFSKQSEVFSRAYKKAKERIGLNREQRLLDNKFNETVYKKSINVYDTLQRSYDREDKAYEASLKNDSTTVTHNHYMAKEVMEANPNLSKDLVNDK